MADKKCPNLQKSIKWCEGEAVYPGIRRRLYFISKSQIAKFAELARDEQGKATAAELDGNIELLADVKWLALDVNPEKCKVTSDAQGEMPSQTQLNKATFVHNGVGKEASAAASYLNNNDNVFVFQTMSGEWRVLGNPRWTTKTTVAQDTGQGTTPASTTISVEVTDEVPAPFYKGTLVTEEGSIDCSTGKVTPGK